MVVVDTNILLYAADRSVREHPHALAVVEGLRSGHDPWALTWGVVFEFLRVATHPRVKVRPWSLTQAHHFITALQASQSLTMLVPTERHAEHLSRCVAEAPFVAGNLVFDFQTAVLMRAHGVRRIYTNDMDFHRFPWVEPENPLA